MDEARTEDSKRKRNWKAKGQFHVFTEADSLRNTLLDDGYHTPDSGKNRQVKIRRRSDTFVVVTSSAPAYHV